MLWGCEGVQDFRVQRVYYGFGDERALEAVIYPRLGTLSGL